MAKLAAQIGYIASSIFLLSACSSASAPSERQHADDWRAEIDVLKYGSSATEEEPIALKRVQTISEYLSTSLDLPVKVYQTSDYNGNIQAFSSGQVHMSSMGAGSYSNVDAQVGDLAEPILTRRDTFGEAGYYSTMIVRADSPYQSIEDLEGKTLAYVDFNSTSGYIYPRWEMRKEGIKVESFFADAAMAGGHTQSVIALSNGQFDATIVNGSGGNPEIGFATGTVKRLQRRGLVKEGDFRTVWTAGPIPNSPMITRTDLPQELRDHIRGTMAVLPYDSPGYYSALARLPGTDYKPVNRAFYVEIIEMRKKEIATHRAQAINGDS